MQKTLYVCEVNSGGIMEYALRQAEAIAKQGVAVEFVCPASFPVQRMAPNLKPRIFRQLTKSPARHGGRSARVVRMLRMILETRSRARQIREIVAAERFDAVLFSCYKEYLAPFWVRPLQRLARGGVRIGTIAHDPVRDFRDEIPGYEKNREICEILAGLKLKSGEEAVSANLVSCYEELVSKGVFPSKELDLVKAWAAAF